MRIISVHTAARRVLPCTAKCSIITTEQKHAEKENFMKRKLSILLIVLIFVAGIGIMSYPLVSSAINNYVSRSRVKEYTDRVAQMPSEKTQKMFEEATKYNNSLSNNMIITDPFDEKAFQKIGANYEKLSILMITVLSAILMCRKSMFICRFIMAQAKRFFLKVQGIFKTLPCLSAVQAHIP